MNYGKLDTPGQNPKPAQSRNLRYLALLSLTVLIASAATISAFIVRSRHHRHAPLKPTRAISQTCQKARFPSLCLQSLLEFPGSQSAYESDLVRMSVNITLRRFTRTLNQVSGIGNVQMSPLVRSAYEDCLELLDDSVDLLDMSLKSSGNDALTWLSAVLTNHGTCSEGFESVVGGQVRDDVLQGLVDLSELVSNSLALFAGLGDEFSGVPVGNRRLLGAANEGYPDWLSSRDRLLMDLPVTDIRADVVVSRNGSVKTIEEAIKMAPDKGERRFVIYVTAGWYEEKNLKVGKKKTNLMLIGDGKGKTVITGGKSVSDMLTTFHTASFAARGNGFIARDMTFENYAGPGKHQAVALRVGSDHSVIYRCNIIGYQDTLYVHSQRQFYRECDIYGTVDFIFGNAAVVLQNCTIYARKPMESQKNTVTAQNRKDPNQNTGISIQASRILPVPDLENSYSMFPTYLGRPWKLYSRTVYMQSYLGQHIHPSGWLAWNNTFALDTLYYGEYLNNGPGSPTSQRVKWPGYRVINSSVEAIRFTVGKFISGSSWLPSTGVAFVAGLN